jgi:hypothetical protein
MADTMDFPALYRAVDRTAVRVQRLYLFFLAADLICLALVSVISSFEIPATVQVFVASVVSMLFVLSIVFTFVLARKAYERTWYRARAVAESMKTLAWRYMTHAPPYTDPSVRDADVRLLEDMRGLLKEAGEVPLASEAQIGSQDQITASMRAIRAADWQERKTTYMNFRVRDQLKWYAAKAKWNDQREGLWFGGTLICQVAALGFAVFGGFTGHAGIGASGGVAALAASSLAWLQAKDFGELSQAYAVTAHELGFILSRELHIKSAQDLSDFVNSSEDAISREHTLWLAKRDRRFT